jgi:hypothetical protein
MSSWKRVLTTDDLSAVSDTNLATSDLSQTVQDRVYTLDSNADGSSLIFEGDCQGNDENLLRIVADANSALQTKSYVYSPSLRIGSFALTGAQDSNGYSLPQHNDNIGSGEIMVSDNFGVTDGAMSFKTFGEYLNPTYGVGLASTTNLDAGGVAYSNDSYLIYDATVNGFKHINVSELRAPMLYHFGSTATGQTVTMRGVNGVQHNVTTNGVTAVKAMNLASLSYSVKKTASGSGTAKFEIYRNGTKYMETGTVVDSDAGVNTFIHGTYFFTGSSGFTQPKIFASGDWFAVRIVKDGTCNTGAHQVTLRFV